MPAPALLLGMVKKRAALRLAGAALSALVLCCIMAFCGSMALMAVAAQGPTAMCMVAVGGLGTTLTVAVPGGASISLSPAQVAVARSYIAVGRARSVPDGGIVIALMMALQESDLQMLANPSVPDSLKYPHDGFGSDHDSIGSAQQRSSAGWGSVAQLMKPGYNAEAFYGGPQGPNHGSPKGLLDIQGWQRMDKGSAVQDVQGSAYPERYARWQSEAEAILKGLGSSVVPTKCSSNQPGQAAPALPSNLRQLRRQIIGYAQEGVGGAYVWGGTAFKAWDCSGYVQWVYGKAGIRLPRTEQWKIGRRTTHPQPGDLIVQIPDGPNHWAHVGIYAGQGMMYSALNPGVGTLLHSVTWNNGSAYFQITR